MPCPPYNATAGNRLIVSSTTRPTGFDLVVGREIYEADTGRTLLYDGTGWVIMDEPLNTNTTACFTNFTGGTPSYATSYHRSDGWIDVVSTLTFGAAPGTMASLTWTPPIAGAAIPLNCFRLSLFDASAGSWYDGQTNEGTTSLLLFASSVSGVVISIANITLTVPMTWAASDRVVVSGRYRMTTRYS